MNESIKRYPNLDQILSAYFHPTWTDEVTETGERVTEEPIVARMIHVESTERLRCASAEIQNLLTSGLSDEQTLRVVRVDFNAGINPRLRGTPMRTWLTRLANRIEAHLLSERKRQFSGDD